MSNKKIEFEHTIEVTVTIRCTVIPGYPPTRWEPGDSDEVDDVRAVLQAPDMPDIDITDYLIDNDALDLSAIEEIAVNTAHEIEADQKQIAAELRYDEKKESGE